jgi:hypothetical protein
MKPSGILPGLGILALLALPFLEPWHACGRHAAWTTTALTRGSCRSGQRSAAASLKTLATAQADYRANDRDGNGIADFWRGDVSGLYGLCPKGSTEMIKLIEISVAGADDRPTTPAAKTPIAGAVTAVDYYTTRSPKGGYRFRAIRHADEKDRADAASRFAFCCFPDAYPNGGRFTYVINEGNTIFKRDLGRPGGIEVFPTDEELKREWTKLD